MSLNATCAVWCRHLSPMAKLVLLAHADFANQDGDNIFPSVSTIAAMTGLRRRAVQQHRAALVKAGLLVNVRGGGGKATAKFYIDMGVLDALPAILPADRLPAHMRALVHDDAPVRDHAPVHDDAPTHAPGRMGGVHHGALTGAPPCTRTVREPSGEPGGERVSAAEKSAPDWRLAIGSDGRNCAPWTAAQDAELIAIPKRDRAAMTAFARSVGKAYNSCINRRAKLRKRVET